MERSLLNYCGELYVIINDIVKKTIEVNSNFFEVLKDFFEAFERLALIDNFSQVEIQSSKYALTAFLDELISYYYPNVNHNWPARSLQLYYYQTNIAGHKFFENLDGFLIDKDKNRSILEIYYFCLQLNFKGQYHQDSKIDDYRQNLKIYFESSSVMKPAKDSKDSRDQWIPLWLLLAVIIFLILIMYAVFIVFVNEKILVVTADLDTYAEQLQDV